MITVETTLENEYLDTLAELCDEKVKRVKQIESLENRIAHERYMIKTLEEKMSTNSENYRKDIENTVAAALAQQGDSMNKGKQKLVEKRVTAASMKELKKLVGDMYWDYDRMSSSGQETLDKIADILGIE